MTAKLESDLWVFGYGSLMWRPGFSYAERRRATLNGWHRSLCVYSHVYRGTLKQPGLVLGLDQGGQCHGVAFRIEGPARDATIRYLREREQVRAVYVERMTLIALETGKQVAALTYVADRQHPQYAGQLDRRSMLERVCSGVGTSGKNADYITETNDHLIAIGVRDPDLEWLSANLREAEPTRRGG